MKRDSAGTLGLIVIECAGNGGGCRIIHNLHVAERCGNSFRYFVASE
jgi:hypothetical protein